MREGVGVGVGVGVGWGLRWLVRSMAIYNVWCICGKCRLLLHPV